MLDTGGEYSYNINCIYIYQYITDITVIKEFKDVRKD